MIWDYQRYDTTLELNDLLPNEVTEILYFPVIFVTTILVTHFNWRYQTCSSYELLDNFKEKKLMQSDGFLLGRLEISKLCNLQYYWYIIPNLNKIDKIFHCIVHTLCRHQTGKCFWRNEVLVAQLCVFTFRRKIFQSVITKGNLLILGSFALHFRSKGPM